MLMNGIISDAGSYRNHPVRILGSNVPTANHLKIPVLMNDLMKDIDKKGKDIINLVSETHSRFEQIHPFSDGNGRIGRMIMQAMLLIDNFAPAVVRQEKKNLYYTYLNKSQINEDLTQLEDFVCDAILYSFDILERKNK
jgi:Fic family protein